MVIYAVRAKLGNLILGGWGRASVYSELLLLYPYLLSFWITTDYSNIISKMVKSCLPFSSVIFCQYVRQNLSTIIRVETLDFGDDAFLQKHLYTISNQWKNTYIQYIYIYKDIHKCVSYARSNLHFLHVQPKQIMHATKHATRKGLSWMDDSQ